MKNGDMPANAIPSTYGNDFYFGLTKREMFAMAAMQAIITKGDNWDGKITAVYAIRYADELLDILDK